MARKSESINVKETTYPKKNREIHSKNKLYCESTFFGEIEYQLDYSLSVNDQFTNLYKFFRKIESRIKKLYDDYLFLKLYKYAVVNDCEIYNNNVLFIESNINKLRNKFFTIDKEFSFMKAKEYFSIKEIEDLYEETMYIVSYVNGMTKEILKFRKTFYKEFKLTSFLPINGKNTAQIEDLIARVDEEIEKFKDVNEAYDYYVYNSSNEIYKAIDELLVINKKGIKLNYHYFIESDAILSFTYNDWLDLMTKFKYVFEKIKGKIVIPEKFEREYRVLETRFAICLIAKEKNNG